MSRYLEIPTDDEDELWMFERTAAELQKTYGHAETEACALINAYYRMFFTL